MPKPEFYALIAPAALCFLLIGLVLLLYPRQKKRWRIKSWQKSLNVPEHAQTFHRLYSTVNGFNLSREARNQQDALDYIYGEIEFLPFIALLSLAKPDRNTVFYDLGCGVGKAVLACAMVYPVRKSIGVELLPELYKSACEQKQRLSTYIQYGEQTKKIQFILTDFLQVNLEDATFVFVNSSTLFGSTWENLCAALHKAPQLDTIITTSKPLISELFTPQISTKIQMSWGIVPVYIHQRKQMSTNLIENIE